MQDIDAAAAGKQGRILGMSTVAFTACFAVWTIFSIIGVRIKADLGLSDAQFGLLVGTRILRRYRREQAASPAKGSN